MKPVCKTTHRQLTAGTCPWCSCDITDGVEVERSDDVSETSDRVWNVLVLSEDLDADDAELRLATVGNLLSDGPPGDVAIPLLNKALNDQDEQVRGHACQALSRLGHELPDAKATDLESQVTGSNDELALRLLLIGYYFLGQRHSKAAEAARLSHILWLIEHAPAFKTVGTPYCFVFSKSDPEGYERAKQLWLSRIQTCPRDTAILANAAQFFTLNDTTLSEKLLTQGEALEPENPHWPEQLGRLYSLKSRGCNEQDTTLAAKSFAAYENAEQVRSSQEAPKDKDDDDEARAILSRLHALPALARSAFDACEFEQAANYASELLEMANNTELREFFRNDGDAIHQGNLVLGRVALEMGELEQSKIHLLASGKTSGSPSLSSFGPNMSLAKELLGRGERDVVLDYFVLCSQFWKSGADRLGTWTEDVKQGNVPDFSANLRY